MREKTKFGLAVVSGLLAAFAVAAPASAAPSAAPGGAVAHASAKAPAAAPNSHPTSRASKLGTASGVGGARTQHLDGSCNSGDLCLWYFAGFQGSTVDFFWGDDNLGDNVFLSPGSGQGAVVANNAESAWNYDPTLTAWTCSGTFQTGDCGHILPNSGGDFIYPTYFNNVESIHWSS
jgi:Peptidase inhibitor family I36